MSRIPLATGFFLLVFHAAFAGPHPCQSSATTIISEGLGHNSFSTDYRQPFGAVPTNQGTVRIRFRTCQGNVDSVVLHLRDNGAGQESDLPMKTIGNGTDTWLGNVTYWEASVPIPDHPALLYYRFLAHRGNSVRGYLNQDAVLESGGWGQVSSDPRPGYGISVYQSGMQVPDWLKGAVIYQIFPDRFRNGDPSNDPANGSGFIYGQKVRKLAWNQPICDPRGSSCPGEFSNQFYGGDLAGVIEKLPYLAKLGINAIYLNPIFQAVSNHRYDTQNYLQIDPILGNLDDFLKLASRCRELGIHLILDGVFNHTSSDSPYFDYYDRWSSALELSDVTGPGENDGSGACESSQSPFRNWYTLPDQGTPGQNKKTRQPLLCPRIPVAGQPSLTYESYSGVGSMPKLNSKNPDVQNYFFAGGPTAIAPYWVTRGASGFRLDVGGSVDPGAGQDPSQTYWRGMRKTIQAIDPQAVLIGEEWGDASSWLLGGQWDSTMNYRFRSALLNWMFDRCSGNGCSGGTFTDTNSNSASVIGPIHPIAESDFDNRLRAIQESYPPETWQAMMNLLGSHDTNRILFLLSKISGDDPAMALRKLKFLWAFLFTYPGAPTVYYGDEAGLATSGVWDGSRWQADPYCRAAYPWHDLGFSPNEDLRQSVRILAGWRQTYPALRQGTYRTISTDDKQHLFSFRRDSDNQTVYVALNRDSQPHDLTLPVDSGTGSLTELFSGTTVTASNGKLAIHQMGGLTAQVFVAGKK